jgi:hypothetical protein
MAEETLVTRRIRDSIALVKHLDRQGDETDLVAWCWFDDDHEWRLLLAGPTLDAVRDRPKEIRSRVARALQAIDAGEISIFDVKIVPGHSGLPRAIKAIVKTAPRKFVHERIHSTRVEDVFLDDVVVLRSVDREYLKQHPVPH